MTKTIYRRAHKLGYTVVCNEAIDDPTLTGKAKWILIYLLSKPDDWKVRLEDIMAHCKDGRDAILGGIKELKQAGYLVKQRVIDPATGRIAGWETLVYEKPRKAGAEPVEPETENPYSGVSSPDRENPYSGVSSPDRENPYSGVSSPDRGNPHSGKPSVRKTRHILNTDLPSTDLPSTEIPITHSGERVMSEQVNQESEPSKLQPPVNPVANQDTPQIDKQAAEGRYSAARNFSPEEIAQNPSLKSDLRLQCGGYKFPELIAAGLEELWVGPGWGDFNPDSIAAARRHLEGHNKPSAKRDAQNLLKNLVKAMDWAGLEGFRDAGLELAQKREESERLRAAIEQPPSDKVIPLPVKPSEPTPEERAESAARFAKLKEMAAAAAQQQTQQKAQKTQQQEALINAG